MILAIIVVLVVIVFTFTTYKHIRPIAWNIHNKINQGVFSDKAIEGYDPVAYFTQQKAIKGEETNSYKWDDATWYFSSAENMNLFKASPEKYAPQFGGYCSYAVSTGFTAKIDPEAFQIIDEKLYLYNDQSFKTKWNENPKENLEKDATNWLKTK
ncbi:MAG: YHS domain-containing (seleno)protein [Bacteroidia bacterium]